MSEEFSTLPEIQVSVQMSAMEEPQPVGQTAPDATSTQAPANSPAERFVAAACQVRSHVPFAVLDCADCYHVVQGSSSRSAAEAQQLAELLNAWDEDEQVPWPLKEKS